MRQPWNKEQPIETVFQQLEEAIDYVQHGNSPFTHFFPAAHIIMAQAKVFKEACREWRYKDQA